MKTPPHQAEKLLENWDSFVTGESGTNYYFYIHPTLPIFFRGVSSYLKGAKDHALYQAAMAIDYGRPNCMRRPGGLTAIDELFEQEKVAPWNMRLYQHRFSRYLWHTPAYKDGKWYTLDEQGNELWEKASL